MPSGLYVFASLPFPGQFEPRRLSRTCTLQRLTHRASLSNVHNSFQNIKLVISALQARGIAVYLISGGFRWVLHLALNLVRVKACVQISGQAQPFCSCDDAKGK